MTTLNATLRARPYAGPTDLPALLALWPVCRPTGWETDFPSPADLIELLAAPEVAARTQVWEDAAGQVAGVRAGAQLRQPVLRLVAGGHGWRRGCARRAGASLAPATWPRASGNPASLDTAWRAADGERIPLLRRHGFAEKMVRTLRYARSLAEPIPEPALPQGYVIRPVVGEAEVEALVALHRAAFGTEHMTAAERLTWMRTPDYDPALDLAAVAPDGSLAAYCFCALDREENRLSGRHDGATDPVATHPAHQGRGLARALLCAGMTLLRARGAERALLGTSSANRAMQAAAQAVGYRIESERVWFHWRAPAPANAG